MVFSKSDMEILCLIHRCGNVRPGSVEAAYGKGAAGWLIAAGLIHLHEGSGSFILTNRGRRCLEPALPAGTAGVSPSYRSGLVRRRIHTSDLVLTAYRAGIVRVVESARELTANGAVFLPSLCRGRGSNVWGSSRMAAVLRLGDYCCGAYHVYPDAGSVDPPNELKMLLNCAARSNGGQAAFLLAGRDYGEMLTELERTNAGVKGKKPTLGDMWRQSPVPVFLTVCDEAGAEQLLIMSQPDYRRRLARASLGQEYAPPPREFPHCDGAFNKIPFVLAADMDLARLDAACAEACRAGICQIAAAALEGQIQSVLRERYKSRVKLFRINERTLAAAFGSVPILHTPERGAYINRKGDAVDVPPIQGDRKAGG